MPIVGKDLLRAICRMFYLQFCDLSDFYQQFKRYFHNKTILTIIPTDLVANLLLSSFLSFLTNLRQWSGFQEVGGLVKRNISVFCL